MPKGLTTVRLNILLRYTQNNMNKLIILFSIIVLSLIPAKSNVLSLEIMADTLVGKTVGNELKAEVNIRNKSSSNITGKVKMKIYEITEGHTISFCWGGLCLSGINYNYTAPTQQQLDAKGKTYFDAILISGKAGKTAVNFTFWDLNDSAANNVSFDVAYFNGVTSVSEISPNLIMQTAPNPASQFVKASFSSATTEVGNLNIYNQSGLLVRQCYISAGLDAFEFNVSNLPDGNYFYNITIGKKVFQSSRFIVVH